MPKGIGYGKKKGTMKKAAAVKKPVAPLVATTSSKEQAKWQAEDDARILMRAEEIKRDGARIKAAQAQAKKQMEELARVVKK